jgi:YaiO family outer membrane protein
MRSLTRLLPIALAPLCAGAQTGGGADARPTPFHLEVGAFYHALTRDYGSWRGADVRLMYATPKVTPFVFFSTQTRKEGTQQSGGVGSYVTLNRWLYAILGMSVAPNDDVVLYPKVRGDASLYANVPGVRGLLFSAGLTEIRFGGEAGGRIVSVGPMWYHGHGIYNGVLRVNTDRASGAHSASGLVGGQYGMQGRYWIGGNVGYGKEAYSVLSATPFDVRFTSASASLFASKWIAQHQGLTLRYEIEHKRHAYHRNGVTLSYFVDF